MKLAVYERSDLKKGMINKIRREGNIPGIIYGGGSTPQPILIKGADLQAIFRGLKPGLLATTIFELEVGNKTVKAIVKDIQYHVVNYGVQHVDFALLDEKTPVTVNVPVQIVGAADCAGIKLGGTLRQVIRVLKVKCLPKHIPNAFEIDIRDLQIAQSKRLTDIKIPQEVKPIANMQEVAVVIAKQKA